MSSETELDLKLLDSSQDRLEKARGAFWRDFKIAVILIVAFQFVIFFRFIDLNQRRIKLDEEKSHLQEDQRVLNDIEIQLSSLQSQLQKGARELSKGLQALPSNMHAQIKAFNNDLLKLRSKAFFERPVSNQSQGVQSVAHQINAASPVVRQSPVQQSAMDIKPNSLIASLSEADRKILSAADFGDPEFQRVAKQVVERGIISPMFRELNADKERLLTRPLVIKEKDLSTTLQEHADALRRNKLRPSAILNALNRVQDQVQAIRLRPPQSDQWWQTLQGKADVGQNLIINTGSMVGKIRVEVASEERNVTTVGSHLSHLVQENQAKEKEVATKINDVQSKYEVAQQQIQNYAKPLSVVAVGPREAVLYYPLILSALFIYFVWRYLALGRRSSDLAARYRDLGVSDQVLHVTFGDFPEVSWKRGYYNLTIWITFAVALLPGGLLVLSLHRIWGSADLLRDAPLFLYDAALVLYLLAYIALVVGSMMRVPGFKQNFLHGRTQIPIEVSDQEVNSGGKHQSN